MSSQEDIDYSRQYFCQECGRFFSDGMEIPAAYQQNVKTIYTYADGDIVSGRCDDKNCTLLEEQGSHNHYEISGLYNEIEVDMVLLFENKDIEVEKHVLYMTDITTGYMLVSVSEKKLCFKVFEIKGR